MKRTTLIICLIFIYANSSKSQKPTDNELWTGPTVSLKLNKKFTLSIEEQFRFNQNFSQLKSSFTELGLKYKLNKRLSLKGNFRYALRPFSNNKARVSLDFNYGWNKKKFPLSFKYRLRFQNSRLANIGKNTTVIRNKLSFSYNLSKLVDPFLAYEIYFRLNGKNEFRVSRITIGLDWRISKKIGFSTYFRRQDDIFVKNPEAQNIIGVMLSYNLKTKKKKKKKKSNSSID